jgi:hypothetical protein
MLALLQTIQARCGTSFQSIGRIHLQLDTAADDPNCANHTVDAKRAEIGDALL